MHRRCMRSSKAQTEPYANRHRAFLDILGFSGLDSACLTKLNFGKYSADRN